MARAIIAAALATLVAAGLIYLTGSMADLPQVPLLADIQAFNMRIGMPGTADAAWIAHAVLGVFVYGVIYALLQPILPGGAFLEGATFGVLTWLAMMVVFAPLTGHPLFMQDLSPTLLGMTVAFNLVYGIVLGLAYAAFGGRGPSSAES